MSNDENITNQETEEVTEEATEETPEVTEEATEETSDDSEVKVDHKAELERLKKDNEKAINFAKNKDIENRELREKLESARGSGEGSGLTREDVESMLAQHEQNIRKSSTKVSAESIASSYTDDPDELELIMFHFDNSIVHTDNIRDNVEKAYALANAKRFEQLGREAKRTIKSAQTKSRPSNPGQKTKVKEQPTFTDSDLKIIQAMGANPKDMVKDENGRIIYKRK